MKSLMKTNIILSIILLNVNLVGMVFAQETKPSSTQTYEGPTDLKNITAENITVHGPLKAQEVTITSLTVHGSIDAVDAKLGTATIHGAGKFEGASVKENLTIYGPLTVNNSSFDELVEIRGPIAASQTTFNETLTIYGTGSQLDQVRADKVIVKESKKGEQQRLKLTNSKIKEIIFESDNGYIEIDATSEVNTVRGGQLQNCRNQ